MAEVYAIRRWPDGDTISFHVQAEVESIDCIDMLRPIAVRGLLDAVGEMTAAEDEES